VEQRWDGGISVALPHRRLAGGIAPARGTTKGTPTRATFTWTGAVVLAAVLLGRLVRPWLRRRPVRHDRTESSEPQENLEGAPALAQLLRRLDAYWIRFDCVRPRHRALLEHLETVSPENVSPEMHEGIRRLVETYYRASFGGVRVPTEELHGLEYELARLEREGEPPC